MHQLCTFFGQSWAMPYHDGPQVLHYRSDIFEAAGLLAPTTWDEFVSVAKALTTPERWGCCIGGYPDCHNNVYDFVTHLQSRGGHLLGDNCEARFNSQEGMSALTFLHDLIHVHRVCDPACLNLNSVQSGDYYSAGKAAMMWNWVGFAATTEADGSAVRGLNSVTAIPGGVALNVFWALVVLKGATDRELAFSFLRHLATPEMDRLTSVNGGIGTRLSTWNDPGLTREFPFYKLLEPTHKRTVALPTLDRLPVLVEILNRAIDDALNQRKSVAEALIWAESEWSPS